MSVHRAKTRLRIATAVLIVAVLATPLGGCIVHRIDVQQGNVVTQKQVSLLKKGMSKREVRYVLGTPLVVDPFHTDRWDYYYSFREGRSKEVRQRLITVVFVDEQLDRIDGDVTPAGATAESQEVEESAGGTKVEKPTQKKKGFFSRTWDKIRD